MRFPAVVGYRISVSNGSLYKEGSRVIRGPFLRALTAGRRTDNKTVIDLTK